MAVLKPQDEHYTKAQDICTHLGDEYAQFMGAIVPPIFQNSLFVKPTPKNGIPDSGFVYRSYTFTTQDESEVKL